LPNDKRGCFLKQGVDTTDYAVYERQDGDLYDQLYKTRKELSDARERLAVSEQVRLYIKCEFDYQCNNVLCMMMVIIT